MPKSPHNRSTLLLSNSYNIINETKQTRENNKPTACDFVLELNNIIKI